MQRLRVIILNFIFIVLWRHVTGFRGLSQLTVILSGTNIIVSTWDNVAYTSRTVLAWVKKSTKRKRRYHQRYHTTITIPGPNDSKKSLNVVLIFYLKFRKNNVSLNWIFLIAFIIILLIIIVLRVIWHFSCWLCSRLSVWTHWWPEIANTCNQ